MNKPTDFNDLGDPRLIKQSIEQAQPADSDADSPSEVAGSSCEEAAGTSRIELIRASSLPPEPIHWLWNGYLAQGKMQILAGAPGTGKTTLAMAIAATVSVGGGWPDGSVAPKGNVFIWSGEDDPRDTLVPRLEVSGADMSHVYFVGAVLEGTERRPFDPSHDVDLLRQQLTEIGDVRLLIVDPIVSAVSGDSHKNAEVRRSLQPLADLAVAMDCALLGITHFSKNTAGRNPVERLTGSLAFGALARVVMLTAKPEEEDSGRSIRLFVRAKSNHGLDGGGFEYELSQKPLLCEPAIVATHVRWGKPLQGSARELLSEAESAVDQGDSLSQAKQFLSDLLKDGPVASIQVKADAAKAGLSWATVRRAKSAMRICAIKTAMNGEWVWKLPFAEGAQQVLENAQEGNVSIFEDIEHLGDDDDM